MIDLSPAVGVEKELCQSLPDDSHEFQRQVLEVDRQPDSVPVTLLAN